MFRELILVVLLSNNVFAYNILAIISLPLRSHYMAFAPFFRELANKGHNVTVINNFPDKEATPNLQFIDIGMPFKPTLPTMDYYETIPSSYLYLNDFYRHLFLTTKVVKEECENLLTNKKVKEITMKNKYDVIFVELFESECGLAYALNMFEAPVIGIKSHVLLPTAYAKLGIPFNFASDPYYRSNAGANPSLPQKVANYVMQLVSMTVRCIFTSPNINAVFEEHVPGKSINLDTVTKERMKMVFAYQHHSVTGARLLAPQLLEIAGLHVGTPKPLPKKIEDIFTNAKNGTIYVSFGTYLRPHTMSNRKLQQFFTAFKRLPYQIIWKIDNITVPAGIDNVHISSWWPQLDVLCHPKILAFVSHGGMLSISESAHCGKPMITVPFFGDQFSNAAAVREVGLAITLYLSDLTAENLEESIKKLTSNEMQQNARRVSKLWHDRPQPVMDSAIYWTEYVARHGHAPPSLPSKYSTWFDNTLLDVYVVLVLMLVAVFLIFYTIFKVMMLVTNLVYKHLFGLSKRKSD